MPDLSAQVISHKMYRANPDFELLLYDRLPPEQQKALEDLRDDPDFYGLLRRVIDQLGSDELLLFSSDYPHWQFDDDNFLPVGIPDDLARKIMVDNPHAVYFGHKG